MKILSLCYRHLIEIFANQPMLIFLRTSSQIQTRQFHLFYLQLLQLKIIKVVSVIAFLWDNKIKHYFSAEISHFFMASWFKRQKYLLVHQIRSPCISSKCISVCVYVYMRKHMWMCVCVCVCIHTYICKVGERSYAIILQFVILECNASQCLILPSFSSAYYIYIYI